MGEPHGSQRIAQAKTISPAILAMIQQARHAAEEAFAACPYYEAGGLSFCQVDGERK